MPVSRKIAIIIGLCFWASPVLGEDVLYCTDTEVVGFAWENGKASLSKFHLSRFTIKIVSDTERIVTRMVGDTAGSPRGDWTVSLHCIRLYVTTATAMSRGFFIAIHTHARSCLDRPLVAVIQTSR